MTDDLESEHHRLRKRRFRRKIIYWLVVIAIMTPLVIFTSGKFVNLMNIIKPGGGQPESSIQFLAPPKN